MPYGNIIVLDITDGQNRPTIYTNRWIYLSNGKCSNINNNGNYDDSDDDK